ncbi:hypothetical protein Droror1_Dr00008068 [Drosera rotundifolia]
MFKGNVNNKSASHELSFSSAIKTEGYCGYIRSFRTSYHTTGKYKNQAVTEEVEIRFAERLAEEAVTVAAVEGGEEAVGKEGEGRVYDDQTEAKVGDDDDEEGDDDRRWW